ncbi:5-oxoprolinase subunit C family protein [Devosia sp. CAU 1758]
MTAQLRVLRASPLCTIQDLGRPGLLAHGISASGPMDLSAHALAGMLTGAAGEAGIEITRAGIDFRLELGDLPTGWAGGQFSVAINGAAQLWPGNAVLRAGDVVSITPGPAGNYGYLRFGPRLDLNPVMGSHATSTRAKLGGHGGRALVAGDVLTFVGRGGIGAQTGLVAMAMADGPIRFTWGLHAEYFSPQLRQTFTEAEFRVSPMMDRMGVRLVDRAGVFAGASILSLVSDPILPGDIQILGDGTPIVLMRDHQPTGGYPRIGTIVTADLDRFAQIRAGQPIAFTPVSVEHAQRLLGSRQP